MPPTSATRTGKAKLMAGFEGNGGQASRAATARPAADVPSAQLTSQPQRADGTSAVPGATPQAYLASFACCETARFGPKAQAFSKRFANLMRTEGAVAGAALRVTTRPTFLEFFCGGGMARVGLGDGWRCLFANDIDPTQGAGLRQQLWARAARRERRRRTSLRGTSRPAPISPGRPSPARTSRSPALRARGSTAERSGAFWPFWRLMRRLGATAARPRASSRLKTSAVC